MALRTALCSRAFWSESVSSAVIQQAGNCEQKLFSGLKCHCCLVQTSSCRHACLSTELKNFLNSSTLNGQ